jgi:guanylate kinase
LQKRNNRGSLFIISAPSGTGKTTLCKKLVSSLPDLKFSVSYTTRHPRPGEVNTTDYSFISRNDFMSMVAGKEFLEWAEIYGEFYGTSKKRLEELTASGFDIILDIDTQGAMQIKEKLKEGTYIFVLPPSVEILKERLEKRMTNSKEEIEKRLKNTVSEIKSYTKYDYVIINNIFENALRELEAIITSYRLSTKIINPLWIEERFKIDPPKAEGG